MIKAGRHNISDQRRKQTERILIYDKRTEKQRIPIPCLDS